ncbi:MutS domain V protein [Peptoniphilus sp. oral taxon 375 str. F0436]|nr:MutS domain V protein [Peptoniphilus sp. oral taxon 375 str. F0436]
MDIYSSFASVAHSYSYVRPSIQEGQVLEIKDGRHPMVEANQAFELFVPNDTYLDQKEEMIDLITGPNMAGKSTYMRQVALICILAHIGSFVPASQAKIPPMDRIFTRIGASDNLSGGESTFMVEMKEVATITKEATSQSLIILDEVGRGTGTFDGLSIAWALIEYIAKEIKAKTLFATHYLELIPLADKIPGLINLTVLTEENEQGISFLRKISYGYSNQSFGIDVAQLAGIDTKLIQRAKEIFFKLKAEEKEHSIPEPPVYTDREGTTSKREDDYRNILKN